MIILTDLSEVLIRGIYGIDEQIEDTYGQDLADLFATKRHTCEPFFIELMRGHITEDQFWEIILEDDDWPFGLDEVKLMVSINFAIGLRSSAKSVYGRIVEHPVSTSSNSPRREGSPEIWIVSDHIKERKEEIVTMYPEVFELASKVIWSYDYGLVKNDVGFFHQLLYKNSLRSDEVLLVDDMMTNIWAAAKADIAGIVYYDQRQLEDGLKDYGFRFK